MGHVAGEVLAAVLYIYPHDDHTYVTSHLGWHLIQLN